MQHESGCRVQFVYRRTQSPVRCAWFLSCWSVAVYLICAQWSHFIFTFTSCASSLCVSDNNSVPLFLSLRREPYETHEVQGSWEKMPDDGSVWVIGGRAGERGNRYWTEGPRHFSPRRRSAGTQLDGQSEKHYGCSMLTAYATPCSILLPLALHKKCGEGKDKLMKNGAGLP